MPLVETSARGVGFTRLELPLEKWQCLSISVCIDVYLRLADRESFSASVWQIKKAPFLSRAELF